LRERSRRERGKRDHTSPVWETGEIEKRDKFYVDPMFFLFLRRIEEEDEKALILFFFLSLPSCSS
jgi:hypothetical protein